ncbi:Weak acid resistance protein 1 [Nakaseomyces glabratus]|nr:Weak acid resistance protein 1 [Nakaseomyces glabratus]KTB26163.1 Weak acid resistance protein 1 [Nakaseomyces glabratus]
MEENCVRADASHTYEPGPNDYVVNNKHLTVIVGVEPDDIRLSQPSQLEVNENGNMKRNTFACVKCHDLKQKCRPSDVGDIYRNPCVRCLRSRDPCIFDLAKRKRKRVRRSRHENSVGNNKYQKRKNSRNSESQSSSDNYEEPRVPLAIPNIQQTPISIIENPESIRNQNWPIVDSNQYPKTSITLGQPQSSNDLNAIMRTPTTISVSQRYPQTDINSLLGSYPTRNNAYDESTVPLGSNIPLIPTTSNDVVRPSNNTLKTPNVGNVGSLFNNHIDTANPTILSPLQNNTYDRQQYAYSSNSNKGGSHFDSVKSPKNSHINRLTHSFKKQLQSLVYHQKEKIETTSTLLGQWAKTWQDMIDRSDLLPVTGDPVSAGIITAEEAELRLERFSTDITFFAGLSFINTGNNTNVNIMRTEKPMLFSVVMSCSSILLAPHETNPVTTMRLDTFVLKQITSNIFKRRVDAVQLVQSLLILCLWYNFLEWPSRTKYHFFNYVCSIITKELNHRPHPGRVFDVFPEKEPQPEYPVYVYRLILLVYITSLNVCIFLRQPLHTPYNECIDIAWKQAARDSKLQITEDHKEDAHVLVVFTSLCRVLENIHVKLHELEKNDEFLLYDTSKMIQRYHTQLDELYTEIPLNRDRVVAFFYSIKAYLYQYTLEDFIKKNVNSLKKGDPVPDDITAAFKSCYNCCVQCLENFMKLDSKLIASLPLFHSSRMVYIVGLILLKLRFKVVTSAAFHHLLHDTDKAVALVRRVADALEKASKLFPYNYPLYKLQYVVALFCQTYAKRVIEASESSTVKAKSNPHTQFNTQLLRNEYASVTKTPVTDTENTVSADVLPFPADSASTQGKLTRNSTDDSNTPINNDISSGIVGYKTEKEDLNGTNNNPNNGLLNPQVKVNLESQTLNSSPSSSLNNFNDYLTDMNSLLWGVNTLNDEFWSDLFLPGI